MNILSILDELAATDSRLEKEAILQKYKSNSLFQEVLRQAYCSTVVFGIKKIPEHSSPVVGDIGIKSALDMLMKIRSREITGNAAITYLQGMLKKMSQEDAEVISRVIQKDLRCGVNNKSIDKVFPGLLFKFDVMLAGSDIRAIRFPAMSQIKADGVRCHLYFDGASAVAFSRNGKMIDVKGVFDQSAKKAMVAGMTFDGELVCFTGPYPLDRKTSNGIINKAIRGTITQDEADTIRFLVWDIVDFTGTRPYKDRFSELEKRVKPMDGKFMVIASNIANNIEEAREWFADARNNGHEGTILKNMDSVWEPKRSKNLCKMKAEVEADLRVTDWIEGTGKYVGQLGAITCATDCGKLVVNVGSGFSDEQRASLTRDDIVGKIVTIRFNEMIKAKDSDTYSLFLPRLIEIRFDKDEPNEFGEFC